MGMTKPNRVSSYQDEQVAKVRAKKGVVGAVQIFGKFDIPAIHGNLSTEPMSVGVCAFPEDDDKAISLRIWHGQKINFHTNLSSDQIDELVGALIRAKVKLRDFQQDLEEVKT